MLKQQRTEPVLVSEKRALIEAVIASTVGTTIEWYDFFLYGTAAALVFPKLFFPEQTDLRGQTFAFLTCTAGFVTRPLGGAGLGHLGDRIGRKATGGATPLLVGVYTSPAGLLPLQDQIGDGAAPVS